jgi:hypothetical protein
VRSLAVRVHIIRTEKEVDDSDLVGGVAEAAVAAVVAVLADAAVKGGGAIAMVVVVHESMSRRGKAVTMVVVALERIELTQKHM